MFFPGLYSAGRSVSDTTLLSTLFYCYWPLPATWATFQRRRRLLNDIWVTCSTGQQSWNGTSGTGAHITLMPIPSIPSSASASASATAASATSFRVAGHSLCHQVNQSGSQLSSSFNLANPSSSIFRSALFEFVLP